jgi:transposase
MSGALLSDLRSRVIAAVEAGSSRRAAAARFGVSMSSAIRWIQQWRQSCRSRARRQGGDRRSRHAEAYKDTILAAVDAKVEITLVELAELLRRDHGVAVAPSTVWRFLDRHDITLKKDSPRRRATESGRGRQAQPDLDPERLFFIDETSASTKMARLYGRSKRARERGRIERA